jgi:membrane protein
MPGVVQPTSFRQRAIAMAGQIFDDWARDNAPRLAASLAYYTILSSAPLLVIAIAMADRMFGEAAVQGQLAWEIQTFVGGAAAQAIQGVLRDAHRVSSGLVATIFSIVTLIAGASSVVVELHSALNVIWGIPDPDAGGWWKSLVALAKERLYSSLVVLGAGGLLIVSLIVSISIAAIGSLFRPIVPLPEWAFHLVAFAASFVGATLLFAAIYKLIPDVRLQWSDVLVGASATSLLFTVGKQLLAVYLGRVGFESTYGAAWTVVIVLVWVYYSAQLFFIGAEFTKVYTRTFGSHRNSRPLREVQLPFVQGFD